ncbi:MAG: ATP-dependent DNA helicase [Patescibacteria group bacterium]
MSEAVFQTLYKKLNKGQKEAVDTIEGPVMVIAGPGTGKTTILTLRIANILRLTDTPAHGILALTFTDAGVKAMRKKLRDIIGDRAYDVRIHTFHGFASSVISEYPDHFLHIQDMKQMTDVEAESLLRSIIEAPKFKDLRPSGKPDAYIGGIVRALDDAKKEALTPEMVRVHARQEVARIEKDEASLSTRGVTKGQLKAEAKEAILKCKKTELFADVYEIFEQKKREAKKMDFNDLLIELLFALRNDELLLRLLQEKYLYIHVDEHQDTNDAQNFIVGLIAEFFDTPNIFIVGDEKQAIYRFQGASVENFLLLEKKWPAMKRISLDTNYRSHQGILDAGFGMIEKNYEGDEYASLRVKLVSGLKDAPRPLDVVTAENTGALEKYLVQELKKLTTEDSTATVAIIVRRNKDLDRIIRLLESHAIPVSSERSVDIFAHPVGRVFFDLLEYFLDPSRVDALSKTIVMGMWGVSFEKAVALVKDLRSGREITLPGLAEVQRLLLSDGALGFLVHAGEISGFTSLIARDPAYVHVWRGIIALSESLVREGDIADPRGLLEALIAYRTSAESRNVKVSVGNPELPLGAMTAHASKGLEYDYVFIPYANEEAWIGKPRGTSFIVPKKRTSGHDIADTRRLFYVAITRARKHVTVLSALEESDGKTLTPLRFIDELEQKTVKEIFLPRAGAEETHLETSKKLRDVTPLLHLAQRVILEKGISVTALNHFIECPNLFLYNSILKLPQAPSVSADKGSAMHYAFEAAWKSQDRSEKEITRILHEKIVEYFKDSFLSRTEKESAQAELLERVGAVARALVVHFIPTPNTAVFTETWVEAHKIIPIHGKLDAIVDRGNEVLVFDYKTREAMSEAAIKGETKSSDGNYFRQLIFYKLLLQSDSRWKGKRIIPALVFVSPDEKGRCPIITLPIEESDILRVEKEIETLKESVMSGAIINSTCSELDCEWCALRSIAA